MLVYGNTIILFGYIYDTNTTQIRKYEVTESGKILSGHSYLFVSEGYFQEDRYAVRLIDNNLIFYTHSVLLDDTPFEVQSGNLRDGKRIDAGSAFTRNVVYKPVQHSDDPILHAVQ
jgi:hypothetical protein